MFVKYIVKKGEEAVVIKFDLRNKKLQVGGYHRFVGLITQICSKPYFDELVGVENNHSQRNKLRYEITVETNRFLETIEKISEDFDCERARKVNRLI